MHPCSVIAGNGQKTAQTTWLEQSETQKLANVFWSVAYPSRTQPQVAVPPNLKLHSRMAPRCEIPAWQIPIILCIKLKPQIHHAYNHGQLSIFQLGSCRNGGKKTLRCADRQRKVEGKSFKQKCPCRKKPARFTRKLLQTLKIANLTRSKGGVTAMEHASQKKLDQKNVGP